MDDDIDGDDHPFNPFVNDNKTESSGTQFYNSQKVTSQSDTIPFQKKDSVKEVKPSSFKTIEFLKQAINRPLSQAKTILCLISQSHQNSNDHHAAKAYLLLIIGKNLQTILQSAKSNLSSPLKLVIMNDNMKEFIDISDKIIEKDVIEYYEKAKITYLEVMEELKKFEYLIPILNLYPFMNSVLEYIMNIIQDAVVIEAISNHKTAEEKYSVAKTIIELILEEYERLDDIINGSIAKIYREESSKKLNDDTTKHLMLMYKVLNGEI